MIEIHGSSKLEEQLSGDYAHQPVFRQLTVLGEVSNLEKFC